MFAQDFWIAWGRDSEDFSLGITSPTMCQMKLKVGVSVQSGGANVFATVVDTDFFCLFVLSHLNVFWSTDKLTYTKDSFQTMFSFREREKSIQTKSPLSDKPLNLITGWWQQLSSNVYHCILHCCAENTKITKLSWITLSEGILSLHSTLKVGAQHLNWM